MQEGHDENFVLLATEVDDVSEGEGEEHDTRENGQQKAQREAGRVLVSESGDQVHRARGEDLTSPGAGHEGRVNVLREPEVDEEVPPPPKLTDGATEPPLAVELTVGKAEHFRPSIEPAVEEAVSEAEEADTRAKSRLQAGHDELGPLERLQAGQGEGRHEELGQQLKSEEPEGEELSEVHDNQ